MDASKRWMDPAAEAELLRKLTVAARWIVGIGSALLIACQILLAWGEAGSYSYSPFDYFTREAWISFVLAVAPLVAIYGAWSGRRFSVLFEAAAAGPAIVLLYALLLVEPANLAGEPVHEAVGFWLALIVSVPTALAGFIVPLLAELESTPTPTPTRSPSPSRPTGDAESAPTHRTDDA